MTVVPMRVEYAHCNSGHIEEIFCTIFDAILNFKLGPQLLQLRDLY